MKRRKQILQVNTGRVKKEKDDRGKKGKEQRGEEGEREGGREKQCLALHIACRRRKTCS